MIPNRFYDILDVNDSLKKKWEKEHSSEKLTLNDMSSIYYKYNLRPSEIYSAIKRHDIYNSISDSDIRESLLSVRKESVSDNIASVGAWLHKEIENIAHVQYDKKNNVIYLEGIQWRHGVELPLDSRKKFRENVNNNECDMPHLRKNDWKNFTKRLHSAKRKRPISYKEFKNRSIKHCFKKYCSDNNMVRKEDESRVIQSYKKRFQNKKPIYILDETETTMKVGINIPHFIKVSFDYQTQYEFSKKDCIEYFKMFGFINKRIDERVNGKRYWRHYWIGSVKYLPDPSECDSLRRI